MTTPTEVARIQTDTLNTLRELSARTDIPLIKLMARAVREYAASHADDN